MTTTLDELRQRVIDGDTTVTPAQLDKARREAEHAALLDEAEQAAAERKAEHDYLAAVEQLQADVAALGEEGNLSDLRAAYRQLVEAGSRLHEGLRDWETKKAALTRRADALDVPDEVQPLPTLLKPATYLEWAADEAAGKRRSSSVTKGTRSMWVLHDLHDEGFRETYESDTVAHRQAVTERNARAAATREAQRAQEQAEREARYKAQDRARRAMGLG